MSDAATTGIELFKDVSGTEMTFLRPQQIQHHATLPAEAHTKATAALEDALHPLIQKCRTPLDLGAHCGRTALVYVSLSRLPGSASGQIA